VSTFLVSQRSDDAGGGYWYPSDASTARAVEVLAAMRRYRAAEQAMRRRTRGAMGMNETDLLALRILIEARTRGELVTSRELAGRLGISSASVSVLVDRLTESGHVVRAKHPDDRRAVVVEPTEASHHEVRATLGRMHSGMLDVAGSLTAADAAAVIAFLDGMSEVVDRIEPPADPAG
jgi:DNA-binding MarR family transcriptional regulator